MNTNFPTSLKFSKMQGCGNDFIMLNAFSQQLPTEGPLMGLLAERLCHRHFGIGADGILALYPASQADCDFEMRLFQPDGSEAEMCGNGIRCATLFAQAEGIIPQNQTELSVQTLAGIIRPSIISANPGEEPLVRVDMGQPRLLGPEIPCTLSQGRIIEQPLELEGREFNLSAVSMGNPHGVIFLENAPQNFAVEHFGHLLENHSCFPAKANIEFVQRVDAHNLQVRVWERGVGETLACGTGACACAVAAILTNRAAGDVNIHLPGGSLQIAWAGSPEAPVYMTGPARLVYSGDFLLADFLPEAAL